MNVGDRMRLLVVEDDNNIRRGLIKVIKKMHLPIEVFLEAESGDEAITIYLEHRPNIVITDIKMGEITGLDFIEYVRSIDDKVHFIIISGYTDFDYAQRAIRNKVVDYIKKPIDTEYLKKILISTIYNVKENSNTIDIRNIDYRNLLFKSLIESIHQMNHIEKNNYKFKVAYPSVDYHLVIMHFNEGYDNTHIKLRHDNVIACFPIDKNRLLVVIDSRILDNFIKEYKAICKMGISNSINHLKDVRQSYYDASYSLEFRLYSNEKIFYYKELAKWLQKDIPTSHYYKEMLINAYKEGSIYFSKALDKIKLQVKDYAPYYFKKLLKDVVKNIITSEVDIDQLYVESDSLDMFVFKIKSTVFSNQNSTEKVDYQPSISRILRYLDEHIAENITLETVAKYTDMNTSYISFLFKKETGINFIDYLQNLRVTKAKELLRKTDYKIYKIAYQVGFNDDKYFYKLFKKHEGMTPLQYRKKFH